MAQHTSALPWIQARKLHKRRLTVLSQHDHVERVGQMFLNAAVLAPSPGPQQHRVRSADDANSASQC